MCTSPEPVRPILSPVTSKPKMHPLALEIIYKRIVHQRIDLFNPTVPFSRMKPLPGRRLLCDTEFSGVT